MNKVKLISRIIWVLLVVILSAMAALGYTDYSRKIELLEEDSKAAYLILEKTKGELQEIGKKNASLSAENEGLNRGTVSLKESLANIQKAKDTLAEQIAALSLKKNELEIELDEVRFAAKEQISLKQRELSEQLNSQKDTYLAEKRALTMQLEVSKLLSGSLARKNKGLLSELSKSKELQGRFHEVKEVIEENKILLAELETNKKMLALLREKKKEIALEFEQNEDQLKMDALKFHYNLALAYDQGRRYKEAAAEYERALKIAPDDADVHYNLAVVYDGHIKNKKKAMEHYRHYLKLSPQAEDADKVARWLKQTEEELNFRKK